MLKLLLLCGNFLSLQCGRQIAQLKEEYEETKKTWEEEASKLRQVSVAKTSKWDRDHCHGNSLVIGQKL